MATAIKALLLFVLGIIGEYIGMFFSISMRKPPYVVRYAIVYSAPFMRYFKN